LDDVEDTVEKLDLFLADSDIYCVNEEVVGDVIVDDGEVTIVVKKTVSLVY